MFEMIAIGGYYAASQLFMHHTARAYKDDDCWLKLCKAMTQMITAPPLAKNICFKDECAFLLHGHVIKHGYDDGTIIISMR